MKFQWENNKEQLNIRKHGIDSATASLVFRDPGRIERLDYAHSTLNETRYFTIGMIENVLTVLFVVYTERYEYIRIISARRATNQEEANYYDY